MSDDSSTRGWIAPRTQFQLVVAFLVVSIGSCAAIPFLQPWGADLVNLLVYQRCAADKSPYLIDGRTCGDSFGRGMVYPPLLFHSFRWLRGLELATAMRIWTLGTCLLFAILMAVWVRWIAKDRSQRSPQDVILFCALLLFQYPFVFTLERGGTDVFAVAGFTLGALLFVRGMPTAAGIAAGFAAAYKLYPAIAVAVVVVALLAVDARRWWSKEKPSWSWLRYGAGSLVGFVAPNVVYWNDARLYFTSSLPDFAQHYGDLSEFSHSIPGFVGRDTTGFALALCIALALVWCWGAAEAFARKNDAMAFAGALSISTYMARTSFDYNLITTYPLLVLLFLRARRTGHFGLLAFGLFAWCADRRLFLARSPEFFTPSLHLALEITFLVTAAMATARGDLSCTPESPLSS